VLYCKHDIEQGVSRVKNIELLMLSLEYIERHIREDLRTSDIAAACFCSRSTLEKLFQHVTGFTVRAYIVRRRMTLAARLLSSDPEISILSVAVEFGYSSHEAFSRAFREVWGCSPSDIRGRKYVELFPRFTAPIEKGDTYIMERRSVDISQLYDLFRDRRDCWFVLTDMVNLIAINEISRKAGDLCLVEQMNRMLSAVGEDDVVFRIGGDEFCILTASTSEEYANGIIEKIRAFNGQPVIFEGQEIPLSLYTVATRFSSESLRYSELFSQLHFALRDVKSAETE